MRGISASSDGQGVHGEAISTTGTAYGGFFASFANDGRGVYGLATSTTCLLYTSDAADDLLCVDLGGRRTITKKTVTLVQLYSTAV